MLFLTMPMGFTGIWTHDPVLHSPPSRVYRYSCLYSTHQCSHCS